MTDPIEIMARASYERELSPYGSPWSHIDDGSRRAFLADMRAALSALYDAGFVVVPVEPTEELIAAGLTTGNRFGPTAMANIYSAMIQAAQVPHDEA